jgi:hypothetical protein
MADTVAVLREAAEEAGVALTIVADEEPGYGTPPIDTTMGGVP